MPNENAPFGFRPKLHKNGGVSARLGAYAIPSGYTSSIFYGDLVASDAAAGGRAIALAPDGTTARIRGVFMGVQYTDENGVPQFKRNWVANTATLGAADAVALVMDDPDVELEAQASTLAAGDVGAAFEWQNGSGNARTGVSGGYIDVAQTGVPQIRIEGLVEGEAYSTYAKVRCRILTHELSSTLTTY